MQNLKENENNILGAVSGKSVTIHNDRLEKREPKISNIVNECISRIDTALDGITFDEASIKWDVVKDFSNPTKEEINEQLSSIPALQAYFNNMKIYAQMLMDVSEHRLFLAQSKARGEYKRVHQDRIDKFTKEISEQMKTALRSTVQDKAMKVISDTIKSCRPKEPTDKDVEAYVKARTAKLESNYIENKERYNKIREFCKVLENKFLAVRALRYSIYDMGKVDKNVAE